MGIYAMTGGATGIGAAVKEQLRAGGNTVIVVDIKDADIIADLSTEAGRQSAIDGIRAAAAEGLDGFIPCAGLGPNVNPYSLISKVNYFAVVATVEGVKDLIAKKRGALVLISSNSASMPGMNENYIDLLLAGDEAGASSLIDTLDGHSAYAGSKCALTRWMRRNTAAYAAEGIRMNAVAPGFTQTPLTEKVMADETLGAVIKEFNESIPVGRSGQPVDIANVICFMLSPASSFVCGSVFFVDGGHDAMLRPDQF
ncbi:SDR family oxidoreductase [Oceanicoccus sp. KOV_DT_Chl]|uniref:SDR family oxidoreductase n=1 Tax=Oceanicoccus sp. KOV_DT_Chl TaxID=1904639 RepID=UPI000C7CCC2C|nr:SDR family oxidoreductase [Oceanicoccus sp. KOV_DT_Chl]